VFLCCYLCVVFVEQEAPGGVEVFDGQLVGAQEERRLNQLYRGQASEPRPGPRDLNPDLNVCVCVCLTRREQLLMKAQPLGRPLPHGLHLRPVFELLDLQQRRAVLLHRLHVTTATLEEPQQLVVQLVGVLHVYREVLVHHFILLQRGTSTSLYTSTER